MRRAGALENIWNSGLFIGENRANCYVTVNPSWTLELDGTSGAGVGAAHRLPFRRWADTGADIDVPPLVVEEISINRGLDQDCGQLTLKIRNIEATGGPNLDGQGFFSVRQGSGGAYAQAAGRWPGRTPSAWGTWGGGDGTFHYGYFGAGVLVKTFQGYGGIGMDRESAVSAGHVVPTGVWVIDDTNETADGYLTVVARDIGQVLVDQVMYPPFMPAGKCYPTQFYSATWNQEVNDNPAGFYPTQTNYADLTEIVQLIALWAGFHNPEKTGVLGLTETTGIDSPAPYKAEFFDKKPPIDPIKEIGKVVGYRAWIDQEGGFHWHSQNVFAAGNLDYNGSRTNFAFDIDELKHIQSWTSAWTKRADRSNVIVSQGNPEITAGVKHANFNTNTSIVKNQVRGMVSPAFFQLDRDIPLKEMVTMAELTGLRMWFARHRGTVQASANPLIDVDDQVRIWEKHTWETYLHRVRSVSTTQDTGQGTYTMNLELQWVGPDNSGWEVTVDSAGHVNYNGGTVGGM